MIRSHHTIEIDDYKFKTWLYREEKLNNALVKPLFVYDDIMALLGVKNPLKHPFFKKNHLNAYFFDRFTK